MSGVLSYWELGQSLRKWRLASCVISACTGGIILSLTVEQVVALEELLVEVEDQLNRCEQQLFRIDEAMAIHGSLWGRALAIPTRGSDEWRAIDRVRRETPGWWRDTPSGYVSPGDCAQFSRLRTVLKQLLDSVEPEFLRRESRPRSQQFFAADEVYEARSAIFRHMKRAQRSLAVVDQFLDETIFVYLESLETTIGLKLLTGGTKLVFKTILIPFARQRGNVEARINTECHDRFILIDEIHAVHLGASINHAGESAFMVNEVQDKDELARLLAEFQEWWTKGEPISG